MKSKCGWKIHTIRLEAILSVRKFDVSIYFAGETKFGCALFFICSLNAFDVLAPLSAGGKSRH